MTLQPIDELDLTPAEKLTAVIRGWCAIDLETGAHLSRSRGRTSQAPKYCLILPNESIEARGGLFARYDWDYPTGRKFVRGWTEREAIDEANKKLGKMVKNAKAT